VRFEVGRDGEVLVQEAEEVGDAVAGVVLNGEELDAVAGGEDEVRGFQADGRGACGVGEAGQGMASARAPRWARWCG